jgi:hypothetical protein
MKKIAHSLLVIGVSCWFLAGCMGGDMEGAGESEQALAQEEDAYLEQEASSYTEEDLGDADLEREGEYWTEVCSGWAGYGSACQVRCSNGGWYTVGYHPNIGSGDCTSAGIGFCAAWGMNATGHCWN